MKSIRDFKLSNNHEDITHQNIVSYATYSPWYDDKDFMAAYDACKKNTLVDIYRCFELWNFVKMNNNLKGDILEVGVWQGGTGCLLAKSSELFSQGNVFLADTFKGVVKATNEDTIYKGGEHADSSVEIVNSLIDKLNITNTKVLKGVFPDEISFESLNVKDVSLKLCHIDVDTYSSAKDIFNYVWPFIIKGGAVIFDDYGFWGCEGVTKLVNEIKQNDTVFIYNLNGHGILIKI